MDIFKRINPSTSKLSSPPDERRHARWVGMSLRPSCLPPPGEDDIQRAREGDGLARRRVYQQRFRAKKRKLEIDKYDVAEEAR